MLLTNCIKARAIIFDFLNCAELVKLIPFSPIRGVQYL